MDCARVVFYLHDRAAADEQTGEVDGFGQITAAVAPQVEDEAGDAGVFKLLDEPGDVFGGAGFFAIAVRIAVFRWAIEGGQGNDAEGLVAARRGGDLKDSGMRSGGIQFNDIAVDDDFFAHGGIGRIGRLDDDAHLGVFLTTDHVYDLAQFHADDFDGLGASLGDGDDAVVGFEFAPEIGGTAGNDFFDVAVIVFDAQERADADELEFHLNPKILEGFGGEIGGMRVVKASHASEVNFGKVSAFDLGEIFEHALVAFVDRGLGFLDRFFIQELVDEFEFEAIAPEFI